MNTKIEELEKQAADILARNQHWKSCQDGSYEMALSYAGYYKLIDQICLLREELENAT